MPFLQDMPRQRIHTELGYSITCHPSMYTGVPPSVHKSWFVWQRNPRTSPFRWLRRTGLDRLPDSPWVKYPLYRLTHLWARNPAFFSVPFPAFTPLRQWAEFDVTEKRFWDMDGFNPDAKTIFERFRAADVGMNVVGMDKQAGRSGERLLGMEPAFDEFTYLFFGDVDGVSHARGQDSAEGRAVLERVDAAVAKWHDAARDEGRDPLFLLWSDHGHSEITKKIDPYKVFREHGHRLERITHQVDANYIRFWFRSNEERRIAESMLPHLGEGFVVDEQAAARYDIQMPDDRFGQLIYCIDPPQAYDKGEIKVLWKRLRNRDVSTHGYRPDLPAADGVLVSNRPVRDGPKVRLQDIAVSLLDHFGLEPEPAATGRPLW